MLKLCENGSNIDCLYETSSVLRKATETGFDLLASVRFGLLKTEPKFGFRTSLDVLQECNYWASSDDVVLLLIQLCEIVCRFTVLRILCVFWTRASGLSRLNFALKLCRCWLSWRGASRCRRHDGTATLTAVCESSVIVNYLLDFSVMFSQLEL